MRRFGLAARRMAGGAALALGTPLVGGAARAQMLPDTGAAAARTAQWRFESYRRARLPIDFRDASPCDAQIGRFCYSNGSDDGPLPDEPKEVAASRAELLARLAASDSAAPNDWVAGQLVRYLVEAGRDSDAVKVARHCGERAGGGRWWCGALLGFALHASGDDAAAGAAYDSALAAMPDSTRCHWSDVSLWLDGGTADRYKSLDCAGKEREARRIWWLARPLIAAREDDEARVEFLARRTMAMMLASSRSPFPMSWGADIEELGLRYGWPVAWTQLPPRAMSVDQGNVVGHDPRTPHAFVPAERAFADPTHATQDDWVLGANRISRSYYAAAYADSFYVLPHQLARFRRGVDSSLVVAAYDVDGDSAWTRGPLRAAFALATGPDSTLALEVRDDAPSHGALLLRARARGALAGVELYSAAGRRAARSRYGVAPLAYDAPLSDILLVRADGYADADVAELEDAAPRALGTATVGEGERVGLFWETYVAPAPDAPLSVSLTIVPTALSLAQRIAIALRLAERPSPVTLKWDDTGRPEGPAGHVMVLNLAGVPPGKYRLELAVSGAGMPAPAVATREIEVRESGKR